MKQLYNERLNRYVTAMRNEKPDKIPIRPFVAEFTARYAGYTCQEVTHDYEKAFIAARKCAADFDWDAIVANLVYVWTGLTQAIGLKYYYIPGIDISAETAFQYLEPNEENAYMKADEYDQLIDDPTAFLYNVWLPRVSDEIRPLNGSTSYRNNIALVKGGMAMLKYFNAFGPQNDLLRSESGTVSAIAGILKAPFDILADKLRGYVGLASDMMTQPKKVLEACEALMPHLYDVAQNSADDKKQVPIGFWMHRGCTPFFSPQVFESHFWSTTKPIIEELWKKGQQTLFYSEGNWGHHLDSFAELPDKSIVYHVDQGDLFETHKKLGEKFCLSGGLPYSVLTSSSTDQVREYCKKVIDGVAGDGGYIMDATAIMQGDVKTENLIAMTDFLRDYGVYSSGSSPILHDQIKTTRSSDEFTNDNYGMTGIPEPKIKPGVCLPWAEKVKELPNIPGDEELLEQVWEDIDGLANMFIWQCLVSF